MWYIAAAAGIVLAGTLAGVVKSRGTGFVRKDEPFSRVILSEAIKPLSMEQVNFLLARLEKEEPPEPVFGAMCYEMMAAPVAAEYLCPVCGEKTLYEDYRAEFIEWELQSARRLAESIDAGSEFNVTLDETLFCDYCSEGSQEEPSLLLLVTAADGTETLSRVSLTDLRKLNSFLQGQLYWLTETDDRMPLRNSADRMRRLLGLSER